MEIKRINDYADSRFSKNILKQHGCFLVDDIPYEIEIVSDTKAIVHGDFCPCIDALIDEFRFYTPHICEFYFQDNTLIKKFPQSDILTLKLDNIQPSQFYVDIDKINAVKTFIHSPNDIIIQVKKSNSRYIALDGHTRLYYAVLMGYPYVRAVLADSDDCIFDFVTEAQERNIKTPKDLILLSHTDYIKKWDAYCDEYFSRK